MNHANKRPKAFILKSRYLNKYVDLWIYKNYGEQGFMTFHQAKTSWLLDRDGYHIAYCTDSPKVVLCITKYSTTYKVIQINLKHFKRKINHYFNKS